MKKKIATRHDVVTIPLIVLAVWFINSGCLQESQSEANKRMKQHRHLYINDLIDLQKQSLAQVQSEFGFNENADQGSTWWWAGNDTSNSGYVHSSWSTHSVKTVDDPYGCLSIVQCYKVNGQTVIRYMTDDMAYLPNAIQVLKRNKNFKANEPDKYPSGAISNSYLNATADLGILTYLPKKMSTKDPCILVVVSLKNYKGIVNGQINLDTH